MIDKYFQKQLKELAPELLEILKERGVNVSKYEKILQEQREEETKRKTERATAPRRQKSKLKKQITEQREKDFSKAIRRTQLKEDSDDVAPLIENAIYIADVIHNERREREQKRLATLKEITSLALTLNPAILEQAEQRREQARKRQEIIDKVKSGAHAKQVLDYWRAKMLASIKEQTPYMLFKILVEQINGKCFQRNKPRVKEILPNEETRSTIFKQ